jgi:hypothetical protein
VSVVIKPEDRTKALVLIVGVALVIAYIAYTVISATSGAAAPQPMTQNVSIGSDNTTPPPSPEETLIELPTLFAAGDSNPFRTVLQIVPASTSVSSAGRVASKPPRREISTDSTVPFLPPAGSVEGATAPLRDLGLRLDGVISGANGVAVIHFGEESYVLHVGEQFGDGMVVKSISSSGVELGKGKERISLTVGGSSSQE